MADTNTLKKSTVPTLDEIANELGTEPEDWGNFYCRSKNEFICLNLGSDSDLDLDEDLADEEESNEFLSDWEIEQNEETKMALSNPEDYIRLPSQYDLDEMRIMKDFIGEIQDERASDKLWDALEKRRPFRGFKDAVNYLGIEDQWFAFRQEALREIAKVWCKENGIDYVENKG